MGLLSAFHNSYFHSFESLILCTLKLWGEHVHFKTQYQYMKVESILLTVNHIDGAERKLERLDDKTGTCSRTLKINLASEATEENYFSLVAKVLLVLIQSKF